MNAEQLARKMVREHDGNYRQALIAMAQSYLNVCEGVSAGYLRWGMNIPTVSLTPDPPAICDDSWITTGREP